MLKKVFLVEDEIVTREGIRDNMDWSSIGYEFCGEAPDGEVALPLIEETQPDVIITDIKMPFIDGLQLSKTLRQRMPDVKIIILSGHDEFEYAQSALKLGVTEYLLKPVSAQDLSDALLSLSAIIDREKLEHETLKRLQDDVEDRLILAQEEFILRLVMGGISSADAVEQSQKLGLNIVARYYLVILIHIELCEEFQPFDYQQYKLVDQIVSSVVSGRDDVFISRKDMEELVLLMKGSDPDQLLHAGDSLTRLAKQEVEDRTTCDLTIEIGEPQDRVGDLHHSFAESLVKMKSKIGESPPISSGEEIDLMDLIKMDHVAIENYLKFGSMADFDQFFASSLLSISTSAMKSSLVKHYLFVDILLTTTQFMSDLGGERENIILDIHEIDGILANTLSMEQIKEEMRRIILPALTFRNKQANHQRGILLYQAKNFIADHLSDPDLKMNKIANQFNLSPSHFSTVFREEFGETFRDYLSRIRINRAKELLRTTSLQCSEVAVQCGYSDPHYFSAVFKKKTGVTPQQFRNRSQRDEKVG